MGVFSFSSQIDKSCKRRLRPEIVLPFSCCSLPDSEDRGEGDARFFLGLTLGPGMGIIDDGLSVLLGGWVGAGWGGATLTSLEGTWLLIDVAGRGLEMDRDRFAVVDWVKLGCRNPVTGGRLEGPRLFAKLDGFVEE